MNAAGFRAASPVPNDDDADDADDDNPAEEELGTTNLGAEEDKDPLLSVSIRMSCKGPTRF